MDIDYSAWHDDEDDEPTSDISWDELEEWSDRFSSHRAIVVAIIAVAEESGDPERTPRAVWYDPTDEEIAKVKAKAREELEGRYGNYQLSEDGIYQWGDEEIDLGVRDDG